MKAKRILIIDDERPLLETLEMFLTEKGYAVGCAMSAKEGLKQSIAFDPHVIILDIRLPDMNGLDVLKELVRNGKKNIIIITAFHDMDITIKAMKLGAFDYIPKPIDVEELERVIDKALIFKLCPNCRGCIHRSFFILCRGQNHWKKQRNERDLQGHRRPFRE